MKFISSILVFGFLCGATIAKDLSLKKPKSSCLEPDFGFNQCVQLQHWQMGVY